VGFNLTDNRVATGIDDSDLLVLGGSCVQVASVVPGRGLDDIGMSGNIISDLSSFDVPNLTVKSAEVVAKTLLATGFQLIVPTFLLCPESDWTGSFMVEVNPPSGMRQIFA
jgi:hypothetical protein